MARLTVAWAAALVLVACASTEAPPSGPTASQRVGTAAATPLADLNLIRAAIPVTLAQAQAAPYKLPTDTSCAAIGLEIAALDDALGPDLDAPETAANPSLVARGGNAAGDAAVGALRGAAEGIVPFRGWIRKLTGAESRAREVAAAIAAGAARRSFLKGLGLARDCPPPAAPQASR